MEPSECKNQGFIKLRIIVFHLFMKTHLHTVDSLYLELATDQRICSRQREFEIEREK